MTIPSRAEATGPETGPTAEPGPLPVAPSKEERTLVGPPQQLFFVAFMPVVTALFVSPQKETPTYFRVTALVLVLWLLGWMTLARLLRSSVLSLREREFIEAAKVTGAPPWRIICRELLPNVTTPQGPWRWSLS